MANTTETTNKQTEQKDRKHTNRSEKQTDVKSGNKRKLFACLSVILAVCCLGCIVWIVCYVMNLKRADERMDEILESYVVSSEGSNGDNTASQPEEPNDNGTGTGTAGQGDSESGKALEPVETKVPMEESTLAGYDLPYEAVDIKALQEQQNPDIYAWISIPGTAVDYPVLQHPEEMDYYLEHNVDGTKGYPGCIYTQRMNKKDWSDKNTVLYGHNMKNGTMFAGLHQYEDSAFFEENPYIYIYTEDNRILIYQIFAAYEFSDAHLLMMYSTATDESYQDYLDSIFENDGLNDHFNRELELAPQDKIITLSTCISTKPTRRWLVQGVFIEEGEQLAED